jgi:hypothetical protein
MEHERHIKTALVTIVMMLDDELKDEIIQFNKEM